MIEETLLLKGKRVKVRGTEEYGTILEVKNQRVSTYNQIQFIYVKLDSGNTLPYDPSEIKLLS